MSDLEVPFKDGMKVGRGYDRLTGDVMPSQGAVGSSVSAPESADGQRVTLSCSIVQDVDTLHRSLGISVDAGGSYMGFSGSAKVDYLHSCDLSTFSTYVVVHVTVGNSLETLDEPVLSPDASELVANGNPDRFRQRFADVFISGIKTGGEYFAIYQLSSTSQVERQSLAVTVHAAFSNPAVSAELNTSIKTATGESKSHLEVNVFVYRQGTIRQADLNLEDIMSTARSFPVDVKSAGGNPFPYAALLQPYNRLKSPNDAFNYVEIQNQQDVLADLSRKRFAFLALRDDYSYILAHLADFQNADGAAVDRQTMVTEQEKVVDAINAMQKQAAACARDAGQCTFSSFDAGQFTKPVLKPGAVEPSKPQLPQVEVPNLRHPPVPGIAHALLTQRGLKFKDDGPLTITKDGRVFRGSVVSQNPPAGEMVEIGTVVEIGIGDYTDAPIHLGKH